MHAVLTELFAELAAVKVTSALEDDEGDIKALVITAVGDRQSEGPLELEQSTMTVEGEDFDPTTDDWLPDSGSNVVGYPAALFREKGGYFKKLNGGRNPNGPNGASLHNRGWFVATISIGDATFRAYVNVLDGLHNWLFTRPRPRTPSSTRTTII